MRINRRWWLRRWWNGGGEGTNVVMIRRRQHQWGGCGVRKKENVEEMWDGEKERRKDMNDSCCSCPKFKKRLTVLDDRPTVQDPFVLHSLPPDRLSTVILLDGTLYPRPNRMKSSSLFASLLWNQLLTILDGVIGIWNLGQDTKSRCSWLK